MWGDLRDHLAQSPAGAGITLATHSAGVAQRAVSETQKWQTRVEMCLSGQLSPVPVSPRRGGDYESSQLQDGHPLLKIRRVRREI